MLRIISNSAGELQPVFESILANATRICAATFGVLHLTEDDGFRTVSLHNAPPDYVEAKRRDPIVRSPPKTSALWRVRETRQVIQIADVREEAAYRDGGDASRANFVHLTGVRSLLSVPLIKDDVLVGVIQIWRQEIRPFTDKQIELVQNFAAQAVIAIENTRLLNELSQRTDDLTESLEQQTATSNVLEVISRSAFDLNAVFETVAERSVRLCGADRAFIFRFDGEFLRMVVAYNSPPEFKDWVAQHPIRPGRHSGSARAALERRTIHIPDVQADPEYTYGAKDAEMIRTVLGVPILKGDDLLGVMMIYHLEGVRPFTDKQIALVETFADQAAIAIENVRLFEAEQQRTRELAESLERQTAMSEVLQVISSSPGTLEPVFQSILANATRLCEAKFGHLYSWDGTAFTLIAMLNTPPALAEARKRSPLSPTPGEPIGRMVATKSVVHVVDAAAEPAYIEQSDPGVVTAVGLGGIRTLLAVPLLKETELIGALTVYRQEVRPFTDKQIELVNNFAAQAVIAIENTRLLNELRESLQRQTATSEVLSVISSSPGELEPVFQALLENATRICEANFGTLYLAEGGYYRAVAMHNAPAAFVEFQRRRGRFHPTPGAMLDRTTRTKKVSYSADAASDAILGNSAKVGGARSVVYVPMLKDDVSVGAIVIYRQEVRPFTEKQIELLTNFASPSRHRHREHAAAERIAPANG